MAADLQLDPHRLRTHAARADLLAEQLTGLRRPEPRSRVSAELDRLAGTLDRAARCLGDLAAALRAAAYRAESGESALGDALRGTEGPR